MNKKCIKKNQVKRLGEESVGWEGREDRGHGGVHGVERGMSGWTGALAHGEKGFVGTERERGYCFERLLNSAAHVGAFKNETLAP